MSDMSRPRPLPPASDHERHDRLLVAQLVAGDPLEPERAAEAHRLIAGCGACAALAQELPAVARAVADERVPPRRRDYRISPEQAERLQGNALTRALRRLSLPRSRAFQPAAAGVLSVGLLLVVAGYAWPDGGTVSVQAEPNFIDWSSTAPTSIPADVEEAPPAPVAVEPDAPREAAAADALDGAAEAMEEREFAESLLESQAGMSEGLAQKSRVGQDLVEADMAEASGTDAADLGAAAEAVDRYAGDEASAAGATVDDDAPDPAARELAPIQAPDGGRSAAEPAEAPADEAATIAAAGTQAEDDGGPPELLIAFGLLLALAGGALLLLGWLSRRARDPLAP
jgi:hypothetical protein